MVAAMPAFGPPRMDTTIPRTVMRARPQHISRLLGRTAPDGLRIEGAESIDDCIVRT